MPLDRLDPAMFHTDIQRLRAGGVGGQFWSVWVSADLPELQQVKDTLEQIDLAHSFARRYPGDFAFVTTAAEMRAAHKAGRIGSLLGVEGGGQRDRSVAGWGETVRGKTEDGHPRLSSRRRLGSRFF